MNSCKNYGNENGLTNLIAGVFGTTQKTLTAVMKGKLDGGAQRVPTITGSLTELVTVLGKKVTVDEF